MDYTNYLNYVAYVLGYAFLCWIGRTLNNYFKSLSEECISGSSKLKVSFYSLYQRDAKGPHHSYKKRMKKLEPDRSYYNVWNISIVILLIFNSFILAEFFNNFGNLSSQLPINLPIRLQYSHLIAAIIVFIEI